MNYQMKQIIVCPHNVPVLSSLFPLQILSSTDDPYRVDVANMTGKFRILCLGGCSKIKTFERPAHKMKFLIY